MANIPLGSLAARLGSATGSAVARPFEEGLDLLAHRKLKQIDSQHAQEVAKQQQLSKSHNYQRVGISPKIADFLSNLSGDSEKAALQNLGQLLTMGQNNQQGGQVGMQGLPSPEQQLSQLLSGDQGFSENELNQAISNQDNAQSQQQGGQQPQGNDELAQLGSLFKSPEIKRREDELALKNESVNLKREALAEPRLKAIDELGKSSESLHRVASDALTKVDKAITGLGGKITPEFLQTEDGQKLITDLKKVVLLSDQATPGRTSVKRLELAEGAKAQIWHKPKVIKEILNEIIDDPIIQENIAKRQAAKELDEQHEDLPKNWKNLISTRTKDLLKEMKQERQGISNKELAGFGFKPSEIEELNSSKFGENAIVDIADGKAITKKSGKWKLFKE